MSNAIRNEIHRTKSQTERANPRQVKNNAGGFVFETTDRSRLERFLILGTDGGTFYVGERKLTAENLAFVTNLIQTDEALVRETVVAVSDEGRAYRNDPAIFAVVALLAYGKDSEANREAFVKVVRTATHLFTAADYLKGMSGWGRGKRKAFAGWFEAKSADQLAYQAVKYRQRNGWTLRDVMRLVHPKGVDPTVGEFILKGEIGAEDAGDGVIGGFQFMQRAESAQAVVRVLDDFPSLPWETIPTQFLSDPEVWKTLFDNGQLKGQALVRNLRRLEQNGAFSDRNFAAKVAKALTDQDAIVAARLHPFNFLNAHYAVSDNVMTRATEDGFRKAFKAVEPSGKRLLLAVDVSGSMYTPVAGTQFHASQAAAALAMVVAKTEYDSVITAFSAGPGRGYSWGRSLGTDGLSRVNLTGADTLRATEAEFARFPMGGTDCALPMLWAAEKNEHVDTFVVLTDSETWAGNVQPMDALRRYRKSHNPEARLVVVGMTATNFTIADPSDRGALDVVGFDTSTPKLISDFAAGRI